MCLFCLNFNGMNCVFDLKIFLIGEGEFDDEFFEVIF